MKRMSDRAQRVQELQYPKFSGDIIAHCALGVVVVMISAMIHVLSQAPPWEEGAITGRTLMSAYAEQSGVWASYILSSGQWWFGAAIAAIAFLIPGALNATDVASPLSGISLRRIFANLARIVSSVSIAALIFVLGGMDYDDPRAGPSLFLLCAATALIVLGAVLISSHEGYDLRAALEASVTRNRARIARINGVNFTGFYSSGALPRAIRLVIVSIAVNIVGMPIVLALALYGLHQVGMSISAEQAAALVVLLMFTPLIFTLAVVIYVSTISPLWWKWTILIVSVVLTCFPTGVILVQAFLPPRLIGAELSVFFGLVVLVSASVVLGSVRLSKLRPLNRFLRFTLPGAVLVTIAIHAQRDLSLAQGKLASELARRRAVAKEEGLPVLILPGEQTHR